MKAQNFILLLLLCIGFSSCENFSTDERIPEGFSKLKVYVEDSAAFYLDKITVLNKQKRLALKLEYDTIKKQIYYELDSLRNDKYELTLTSILDRESRTQVILKRDTSLFFKKSDLPVFDTLKTLDRTLSDLAQNDTALIVYESSGCFHNVRNKVLVYKHGGNYVTEYLQESRYNPATHKMHPVKTLFPPGFSDTLQKLEQGCMNGFLAREKIINQYNQLLAKAKNMEDSLRASVVLYGSTTSSTIFIKKGNSVFNLSSNGINEIPYYYKFISALTPKP